MTIFSPCLTSCSIFLIQIVCFVCFLEFTFRETTFQTFLCLFNIRKVGQRKTLFSQRKIWLGFQESVFLENLGGIHFLEVVKNLEISYYLLIISNLILELLIAIYILFWIFIFQFHLLKFHFYINFGPHFYNCYFLFSYHFFYWNFLSIKFGPHSFDCYFFLK